MDGLNSNLNLNGAAPATVVPGLGEWAPENVPSTRSKKAMRIKVVLFLVLALAAVAALWALVFQMLS